MASAIAIVAERVFAMLSDQMLTDEALGRFKLFILPNAACLAWTSKRQHIVCSNAKVQARLHTSEEKRFLWLINPTTNRQTGELTFADSQPGQRGGKLHWGKGLSHWHGSRFEAAAEDALIVDLTEA